MMPRHTGHVAHAGTRIRGLLLHLSAKLRDTCRIAPFK
jgi:hypothetical protein